MSQEHCEFISSVTASSAEVVLGHHGHHWVLQSYMDTTSCITCSQGRTKETEYFYGAEFSREAVPKEWQRRWREPQFKVALHLPAANPFISTDFAMQEVLRYFAHRTRGKQLAVHELTAHQPSAVLLFLNPNHSVYLQLLVVKRNVLGIATLDFLGHVVFFRSCVLGAEMLMYLSAGELGP
jgi:Middle or third domain of peptidase_M16